MEDVLSSQHLERHSAMPGHERLEEKAIRFSSQMAFSDP